MVLHPIVKLYYIYGGHNRIRITNNPPVSGLTGTNECTHPESANGSEFLCQFEQRYPRKGDTT